jgi:hypothetical protein
MKHSFIIAATVGTKYAHVLIPNYNKWTHSKKQNNNVSLFNI